MCSRKMSVDRRLQRASKKTDYYNVYYGFVAKTGKERPRIKVQKKNTESFMLAEALWNDNI